MSHKAHLYLSDIRACSRLAIRATLGVTDIVETMHNNIARVPNILGVGSRDRIRGLTGFVYQSIRRVTEGVGVGIDVATGLLPRLDQGRCSTEREMVVSALNGVLGDHLEASENALAIRMALRFAGQDLTLTREALTESIAEPKDKVLVLVHGLCATDQHWLRRGHDHGQALAQDHGFSPVYLRYNSGLHISENGRRFAEQLEALIKAWPVAIEDLVLLGHSLGGLVSRSAFYYGGMAGHDWPNLLNKAVFLGSPHHGAPLERLGNGFERFLGISPYTFALARLGKIRSAGITDLRYGNLRDEDWESLDRFAFSKDLRLPLPLPEDVECYVAAASLAKETNPLSHRLGDGMVPLKSALGLHEDPQQSLDIPKSRQKVIHGSNHLDLLNHYGLYKTLKSWLC
jgi:pimeloyl-ACP methyl ester carboxylesterase